MADEKKKNLSIRQRTHKQVDNIMDKAQSVGQRGKDEIAHLKEKARMIKKNVDNYIQKNPERSVLIAAGVGLALGAILTAIMMRRKD